MQLVRQIRCGLALLLSAILIVPAGCTRRFYRQQADKQVEEVLTEKDRDQWKIEQWHAYPDPLARFGNPNNPDRPPMPFDDPASRNLSPNPQRPGKAGCGNSEGTGYLALIRIWDGINRQDPDSNVQVVASSSALPAATRPDGDQVAVLRSNTPTYRLTYDQACELALLNSREFQDRREDLYLAALAVTLQRFSFAAQFFAGETFFREYNGSNTVDPGNRWGFATGASVAKLFPTGALLLMQFANSVVLEMSGGGNRITVPTIASLDLTQPLLQGGGRAVTLEPLTQSERNLLYTVRAYARFRKLFHVDIAAGGELFATIPGGAFAAQQLSLSGTAVTEGYLPTLLNAALLVNQQYNVAELERIIAFYRQLQGGGDVSPLQTAQVESQLLNSRSALLTRDQNLRDSLDRFKLQIGVPTDMPLELDDGPVRPLVKHLQRLRDVYDQDRVLQREAKPLEQMEVTGLRAAIRSRLTGLPLVKGTAFAQDVLPRWSQWERLDDLAIAARIQKVGADLRSLLQTQAEAESKGAEFPVADQDRLDDLSFELNLGFLEQSIRLYVTKPWDQLNLDLPQPERKLRQDRYQQDLFRRLFDSFVRLMGTARDQRLEQVNKGWPVPPAACLNGVDLLTADLDHAQTVVAQTALSNRLDLMNARAQLVDAWRQIAVQANSLFGVADVQYHLDAGNPQLAGNPFAFSTSRTRQRLSLNTELPLTRRLERNNYRISLIAYERQRRQLQASEDQVLLEVRSELRALRVLAANYKIQQRAVPVAYSQRDNALETLRVPNPPGSVSSAGNAAALTQQLLGAQSTVLQNENALYQFYVNYVVTRLQLYRDLEIMPLDPRGVWTDEHTTRDCESCLEPGAGVAPVPGTERLPEPRAAIGAPAPETKKPG